VPQHDVVVTNPPYSGDHVERLAAFVVANRKPALVLVPDYFATRSFYAATLGSLQPLCLKPNKQYHYWTPLGRWRAFSLYECEGRWKRLLTRFEFLAVVSVARVRIGLAGGASSRGKAGQASHRNVALGVRTSPFASAWHVAVSQVCLDLDRWGLHLQSLRPHSFPLQQVLPHADIVSAAGLAELCPGECQILTALPLPRASK
jgi:hypothetical protein